MTKKTRIKRVRRAFEIPDPLSLSPQNVKEDLWYYEERGGISVHVWTTMPKAMSRGERYHIEVKIPWRKLQASVRRKRSSLNGGC